MKFKSDFIDIFLQYQIFVENQYSCKIKIFQSDGGAEFCSNRFQSQLRSFGIQHQKSYPYTSSQNGRAERKHRHVTEIGLALLFHSRDPLIIGLMLLVQRLRSSIGCLPNFLEVFLPLRFYMVKLLFTSIFILLVVESIPVYVIMLLINFLHAAFHAYSWVIVLLIKVIVV